MKVKEFIEKYNNYDINIVYQIIGLKYRLSKNKVDDFNIDQENVENIKHIIEDINSGVPVQYAVNTCYFYNRYYYVNSSVLIPRLDSEIVAHNAIQLIKDNHYKNALDLCSGSGCLGLSAFEETDINLTLADISENALDVAKTNINNYSNVKLIKTDMFFNINNKYDIIISNPPYIETKIIKTLDSEVKDYEPHLALDGGEDGLDFYKIIADSSAEYLNKNGSLILEIGYNQASAVCDLLKPNFCNIIVIKDLAGNDRCITCKRKE